MSRSTDFIIVTMTISACDVFCNSTLNTVREHIFDCQYICVRNILGGFLMTMRQLKCDTMLVCQVNGHYIKGHRVR